METKKLLKLDKSADYATLREWCLTICSYVVEVYPEMSQFVDGMKQNIATIDAKQSITQMRDMYKEVNWLVGDGYLTDSAMAELNRILAEKFNLEEA